MWHKLQEIINHYGLKNQIKKFNEESYELTEALNFFQAIIREDIRKDYSTAQLLDDTNTAINNIIEEIADVQVLLDQFKGYFNLNREEIEKEMEFKVNREIERINKNV